MKKIPTLFERVLNTYVCLRVDDLISTQNQIIFTQPLGFQRNQAAFSIEGVIL